MDMYVHNFGCDRILWWSYRGLWNVWSWVDKNYSTTTTIGI